MSIIIGIDVGGSTTKIVGTYGKKGGIISPMTVKANDPVASVYGAFGKFTNIHSISISDIEKVMITGVGSSYIDNSLFNIKTEHVTEFDSIGLGGLFISKLPEGVIVSMGTGTAIVFARQDGEIKYLGGTGVGGGTLVGLSKKMLRVSNVDHIVELAGTGNLSNVDLLISDITHKNIIPSLPPATTAANFGKLSDFATNNDIALGIMNLVFESIGMLAIFAARSCHTKNIILTGNLSTIPQAKPTFKALSEMFGMDFIIPDHSQYSTVIGAALSSGKE